MEQLPEDCLIAIFKYLDRKSKLNAIATCKKFNEIICWNPNLMEEFTLNLEIQWRLGGALENSEFQVFSTLQRKFKKCKIFGGTAHPISQNLISVNEKLGETLRILELNQFKIYSDALIALINSFPNLEEVSFLNLEIYPVNTTTNQQVTPHKLKKVIIDSRTRSDVDIMEVLRPIKTLRHLEIKYFDNDFEDFLCLQKKLEFLKLGQLTIHPHARDIKDRIKFQLKSLSIGRGIVNGNFLDFLETQKRLESLTIMYYNDLYQGYLDELLEIILKQTHLKTLQLRFLGKLEVRDQTILTKTNPSVRNLEINCVGIANDSTFSSFFSSFLRMFPNLEKMRLANFPSASAFSLEIIFALNSLMKLRNFTVDYCPRQVMGNLSFEKLEKFELSNGEIPSEDWIQFFHNNKTIKNLKVEIPFFEESVMLKLSELPDLEKLELNVSVYNSVIPVVEKCKKLKRFQIRLQGCKPVDAREVVNRIQELGFNVSRQAFIITLTKKY